MALRKPEYYMYDDLLKMDGDKRYEIIDGEIYMMASPSNVHQWIVGEIFIQLGNFLRGKRCIPFISPIDVRLNADKPGKRDDTVVQPDIIVVCDRNKLDKKGRGIKGAPDLVVEILSPSTAYRDRLIKHQKYQESGVREYWLVDPHNKTLEVMIFEDGAEKDKKIYHSEEVVSVQVLEGCEIDLAAVFRDVEDFE